LNKKEVEGSSNQMESLIHIFDLREPGFAPTTLGQLKDALEY